VDDLTAPEPDDDPCPACGIPWDLLPIGHDLITPMDGSPQSCEVLPEPDPGIIARWLTDGRFFTVWRDQDGNVTGMEEITDPVERTRDGYAIRPPLGMSPLSHLLRMAGPSLRDIRPETPMFSTWCSPASFIPFSTPEELAAQARESRDEAAAKVLAVLQEQKPQARKRRLPRHCPDVPSYGRIPYSRSFAPAEWE
jgi:hypothetical protein